MSMATSNASNHRNITKSEVNGALGSRTVFETTTTVSKKAFDNFSGPFNTFEDILTAIKADGLWQNVIIYSSLISLILINLSSYAQGIFEVGLMKHTCYKYQDGTFAASFLPAASSTNASRLANPFGTNNTSESIACTSPRGSPCESWNYTSPYYARTMVSEWNLVCAQAYKRSIYQSIGVFGALFGLPVLATMSDMFGRRTVILLSWPLMILSLVGTALAPAFWFAACMRVLFGAVSSGDWKAKIVLAMEVVMPKQRNFASTLLAVNWPIAGLTIAVIGYFIRDWRLLQYTALAVGVVSLPFVLVLPESPRWLITHNKLDRAYATLARASRWNGRGKLPTSLNLKTFHERHGPDCVKLLSPVQRFASLFSTSELRRRSLILFVQWFIVANLFFGMVFYGTGVLPGNPYYTVGLMCCVRIISLPLQVLILNTFGCRKAIIGWLVATALVTAALAALFIISTSGVVIGPAKPILSMIFVVAGTWMGDSAWNALYILTGEIYPTTSRQTGMSVCSMMGRVGGAAAPFIANMLGDVWLPLPATIFAAVAVFAALLAFLLPNTLNLALPDTVQQTRILLTDATAKAIEAACTNIATETGNDSKSGNEDGEIVMAMQNLRMSQTANICVSTATLTTACDKEANHED